MSIDCDRTNLEPGLNILDSLRTVCRVPGVYELRCLGYTLDQNGWWRKTVSGYYDDPKAMARDADNCDGFAKGVYLTLNPVRPELLARACNRIRDDVRDDDTTNDRHILRRTWLPLDFDPVRVTGISSTAVEHDAALVRAGECRGWLTSQGFPDPIQADSGNGGHLLYAIDLPNDDAARDLVAAFLRTVAARFSDAAVTVDVAVFNAARIWKAYGTLACKGDDVPDRPHQRGRILAVPEPLTLVPQEMVARAAALAPRDDAAPRQAPRVVAAQSAEAAPRPGGKAALDVPAWLASGKAPPQ